MQRDKKKIRSILLELMNARATAYSSQRAGEAGLALVRLVEGNYGVCVECGKDIPEARLRAKPEAARCFECQSARERPLVKSS
jgi:phage/conjugal plasmid C-4 type zinc finger TraR family protein